MDAEETDLALGSLVDEDLVILHDHRDSSGYELTSDGFRYAPRSVYLSTTPEIAQALGERLARTALGPGAGELMAALFAQETLRFIFAESNRFGWGIEFTEPQLARIKELVVDRPGMTLSQCFAAAWAATDSCTATVQAHPYMPSSSVASRIINLLQDKADRILEGQWAPKPFHEHREAPIRPITRHVVTDICGSDLMQTPWGEISPPTAEPDDPAEMIVQRLESLRELDDQQLLPMCGGSLPVAALVRAAIGQHQLLREKMPASHAVLIVLGGLRYISQNQSDLVAAARVCGHAGAEALFGYDRA